MPREGKKLVLPLIPLRRLKAVLDELRIPYLIGGSVASSIRGEPRFTKDVDIVAELAVEQVDRFVKVLGSEWYADDDTIRRAIQHHTAFNIIFIEEAEKIDIFPADDPFHLSQLARATEVNFGDEANPLMLPVASAEDIVLAKLRWDKMSSGSSERQLQDIAGVFAANPKIDKDYLRMWATRLSVSALLERFL